MSIRIPYLPKSEQAAPLQACIDRAARETGFNRYQVAVIASYFVEEIANEVALGRVVRIPGFGLFGPWLWTPRTGNHVPRCFPTFAASRAFKNQVALEAPMTASGRAAIERYRQRHHFTSGARSESDRVYSAQYAFRKRIAAEAARYSVDVTLDLTRPTFDRR